MTDNEATTNELPPLDQNTEGFWLNMSMYDAFLKVYEFKDKDIQDEAAWKRVILFANNVLAVAGAK